MLRPAPSHLHCKNDAIINTFGAKRLKGVRFFNGVLLNRSLYFNTISKLHPLGICYLFRWVFYTILINVDSLLQPPHLIISSAVAPLAAALLVAAALVLPAENTDVSIPESFRTSLTHRMVGRSGQKAAKVPRMKSFTLENIRVSKVPWKNLYAYNNAPIRAQYSIRVTFHTCNFSYV